jgi:hypothetical protein
MGNVRWWQIDWGYRLFTPLISWAGVLCSSAGFVVTLHDILLRTLRMSGWMLLAWTLAFCAALLVGRFYVLDIGLSDDAVLVRHAFPGRVERIPVSRAKRVLIAEMAWAWYVVLLTQGAAPVVLEQRKILWSSFCYFEGWDGLVAALKAVFEPTGKLQVV